MLDSDVPEFEIETLESAALSAAQRTQVSGLFEANYRQANHAYLEKSLGTLRFVSLAVRTGGTPPIEIEHQAAQTDIVYANPLPHAFMLTAIVVSVSTTGVALALLIRIHRRFDTVDEAELLDRLRE